MLNRNILASWTPAGIPAKTFKSLEQLRLQTKYCNDVFYGNNFHDWPLGHEYKYASDPLFKIPKFHLISWCGNLVERHNFLCGNCAFSQNFRTRKLGEISVFFAVINCCKNIRNTNLFLKIPQSKFVSGWHYLAAW